jgi:DNA-binding CsgD family transcriptional regulator
MARRPRADSGTLLTPYEQEVFDLIVTEALEYDAIATRLGITHRTVKFHVGRILRKFEVANREQLILEFWKQKLDDERRAWKKKARAKKSA